MFKLTLKAIKFKIILILLAFVSLINICVLYLNTTGPLNTRLTIVFEPGLTKNQIVDRLYDEHVIRFPSLLKIVSKICGLKYQLKSGEYLFTPQINPRQILKILIHGKSIIHKLTIPEGTSAAVIIQKLKDEQRLAGTFHLDIVEGSLLPNTYFYSYGDSKQNLINQMKTAMEKALIAISTDYKFDNNIKNFSDIIILASIIEKETNLDVEKPRIAAVFLNRLKKGMKLQADPTVIYGITLGVNTLNQSLTRKDLMTYTPYNTYMIAGLPPTPIACPGIAALKAVINPAKTKDLYFVSTGNGGHRFADNLTDHNINVNAYRNRFSDND